MKRLRWLYDLWYRLGDPPWSGPPREDLVRLVKEGALRPARALDLGCGTGAHVVFLAQHGFEAVGVDFSEAAIRRARRAAHAAGVTARFEVRDVTTLDPDLGTFDLFVDYGTFDDLTPRRREAYVARVVPLARPGAQFLLWCFEWHKTAMERVLSRAVPGLDMAVAPGEIEGRFGAWFHIERLTSGPIGRAHRRYAVYLMRRNDVAWEVT